VNGISSIKMIKTSRSGEELLVIHPSSSSEESRVLPSWNGSRPDGLSGLVAQKSGLGSGSLEDSMPFRCPSPPDQVEGAERWAEPGSLEDSMPFRCPGLPDQVESAERQAEPGSLEDSVPFRCSGPPDQVGSTERRAEPGSLQDSVPFRCLGSPDQVGGALRPWWPFDKGSVLLMKSERSAETGALRWMVANPPPTCGRRSKSSSNAERVFDSWMICR
jgi:hypothetical protein